MEKMKKVVNNSSNSNSGAKNIVEVPKQKERHIVSWSQEEDDILRDQIRVHGTENWTIIASKFKDKTTRQCRRRWFTYLNSDFKKGGWSPEEDMLLCEAQKIFGNRWTEIAKVVSGRTDNAVKNRFTTLCKKRAKREALAKEKSTSSYINLNNKRIIFRKSLISDEGSENATSIKRTRTYISSECGAANNLLKHPFQILAQTLHNKIDIAHEMQINNKEEVSTNEAVYNDSRRTFLRKDDPKMFALMQQADLLSSLAVKVNSDKTDQSLENAWTVLQEYLKQNEESDVPPTKNSDMSFRLETFKELVDDLRSSNEESVSSWRDRDAYNSSPASSEYSSGSTLRSNGPSDRTNQCEAKMCVLQTDQLDDDQRCLSEENGMCHSTSKNEVTTNMLASDDMKGDDGTLCEYISSSREFSSPVHLTPFFGSLAAAIPSPKFSESEKHFLMKTLGMDSTSPGPINNPAQPPLCKRSLLHCL